MRGPDHEKFPVYRKALEFYAIAISWADTLARRDGWLGDQLRRTASSIILNIAEGAGEFSAREKARFYRMALRSASEAAAILDLLRISMPEDPRSAPARALIVELISELKRLSVSAARPGHRPKRNDPSQE